MCEHGGASGPGEMYYQVLVEDVHLLALSDLLCSHCFRSGVAVASRVFVTLEESV